MKVINNFDEGDIGNRPFIAKFIEGEFFVIVNFKTPVVDFAFESNIGDIGIRFIKDKRSFIKKVDEVGGIGEDFLSGFVLGSQYFEKWITSIEYVDGVTLIGFEDGRILKIRKTGGTGLKMFNLVETDIGFQLSSPFHSNYLLGSHKFKKGIIDIVSIDNKIIICFKGGMILKINGTGGGGYNLFAIQETNEGFSGLEGYLYYGGHQKLGAEVSDIINIGSKTIISFTDGRQIKIEGSGGSGANMFAMIKTDYGFKSVLGYHYLIGSSKYNSMVVKSLHVNGCTFFSFKNRKIIKIKGVGGTGQNMFNLKELLDNFVSYNVLYEIHLLGEFKFSTSYVYDMKYISGYLFLLFKEGLILRIKDVGGTGVNMFNLRRIEKFPFGWCYITSSEFYQKYFEGQQIFRANYSIPQQIIFFDNHIFVAYYNSEGRVFILKFNVDKVTQSEVNMFGILIADRFDRGILGNAQLSSSFVGCQMLN